MDCVFLIVGAGLTGSYLYVRLKELYPQALILLVEASSRIGGRHLYQEGCEFGGMRFFPSLHPRFNHLVEKYGLTTRKWTRLKQPSLPTNIKALMEAYKGDPYAISFSSYIKPYLTPHQWEEFIDSLGYNTLFEHEELTLATAKTEIEAFTYPQFQHTLEGGFQQIEEKLLEGANVLYGHKLKEINKQGKQCLFTHHNLSIKCNHLFLALPREALLEIKGFPNDYYDLLKVSYLPIPAFKIFLRFSEPLDLEVGTRKLYPSPLDQIWIYDQYTLLLYTCMEGAFYWRPFLPYPFQPNFIEAKCYPILFKELSKHFPQIEKVAWAWWNQAALFPRPQPNYEEVWRQTHSPLPYTTVLNNDFSRRPWWSEGCLELVDEFLAQL